MSKTPASSGSVVPAEVSGLLDETRTIQGWLDRLEKHEGDASPEVFDRVRSDYASRLQAVSEKLARHRSDLASRLESRRDELETLEADRRQQAAQLEEAGLRHAVGEFSDAEWEERRTELEGAVGELDELLEMEQGAVDELAAIVAAIDGDADAGPWAGSAGVGTAAATVDADAAVSEGGLTLEDDEDEAAEADAAADPDVSVAAESDLAVGEPTDLEVEDDEDAGAEGDGEEMVAEDEADDAPAAEADVEITVEAEGADATAAGAEEGGEYLDELEFLESLSLDESERFDAVSAMLDEEDGKKEK